METEQGLRQLFYPIDWSPERVCALCHPGVARATPGTTRDRLLCCTFQALSRTTWSTLREAAAVGLAYGGGTITDHNLLRLKAGHPDRVVIRKQTQAHEKATGADWEWWFTYHGRAWGARVQAKKLVWQKGRARYPYFHLAQCQTLIREAAVSRLGAMYCLYNW